MDELDAQGRRLLLERPGLTRGRLAVFRESETNDDWFPRLNVTLKKMGTDEILWRWTSHKDPIDYEEPPPYGTQPMLEKYFELEHPVKSPRGLETVFSLEPGATNHGTVTHFSATLYLYPGSLEERGVQVGVIDFSHGLKASSLPIFFRVNFPW